ncbi:MAG TPA: AAA family ATPase, partial [Planctomycetaceae bacterium]
MPDYPVSLSVLVQVLENGTFLAEALLFPEFSCFRSSGARMKSDVRWLAEKVLKSLPAAQLHARHVPGQPVHGEIRLTIEPEGGDKTWLAPFELRFDVIRWEHPPAEACLGYVPALGIEIVGATAEEREARFQREIRAALVRRKALSSPRELVWLQRGRRFRLITVTCSAARAGAKQAAIADDESRKPAKSALRQVATDLTAESLEPAYECDEGLRRLTELLAGQDPASVLLVGPSGVGKTALVDELVRRRRALGFGPRPFWRSSGARLVAGMSGFGMWEERCRAVCREAAKTQAILHLGNLVELMEVGKSTASTIGIAGFLRSAIAQGELVAIVECTPEQVTFIERNAPSLLTVFHQVVVGEPDPATTRRIIEQTCAGYSFTLDLQPEPRRARRRPKNRQPRQSATLAEAEAGPAAPRTVPGMYPLRVLPEAFDVLDRLHRRYATYSASPGRQVRFMQNLLSDRAAAQLMARGGIPSDDPLAPLTAADVVAAFSRQTGLPKFLLDAGDRLDLAAAGDWFTSRVLGQPDVVNLIVDLLAMVKTGVTRPNRPIASLLFIGPTGVGKTEMSKALATFLFGSPDRLTRFDMSEFCDALSVTRLIGGVFGSEGVLTGKVREQPFSVLLFDEVEKG